jgi:hypothetical protein
MRLVRVFGTAALISLLGTTVPAYSQHGDHGDKQGKHENQAEREKPGKGEKHPGKQPERARGSVGEQHRPQRPEHAQQGPRHVEPRQAQHVVRHAPQGPRHVESRPEHRVVWQERRAHQWASEHRSWQQRGGYRGYRIPHDRYIVYFGPEHRFRVHTLPLLVVEDHPRFQYRGCWFTLVDPWPEYWSPSWYETDDVYVKYVHDGYYMYNVRHPRVGIAISVSL